MNSREKKDWKGAVNHSWSYSLFYFLAWPGGLAWSHSYLSLHFVAPEFSFQDLTGVSLKPTPNKWHKAPTMMMTICFFPDYMDFFTDCMDISLSLSDLGLVFFFFLTDYMEMIFCFSMITCNSSGVVFSPSFSDYSRKKLHHGYLYCFADFMEMYCFYRGLTTPRYAKLLCYL